MIGVLAVVALLAGFLLWCYGRCRRQRGNIPLPSNQGPPTYMDSPQPPQMIEGQVMLAAGSNKNRASELPGSYPPEVILRDSVTIEASSRPQAGPLPVERPLRDVDPVELDGSTRERVHAEEAGLNE